MNGHSNGTVPEAEKELVSAHDSSNNDASLDNKDNSKEQATLDPLMVELGGCGLFQILHICSTYGSMSAVAWGLFFMMFGSYTPPWECMDHLDTALNSSNENFRSWAGYDVSSNVSNPQMQEKLNVNESKMSCEVYRRCQKIRFLESASTIATEWNLICDRMWLNSVIISVQMAGIFLGCCIIGPVGDRFGRKISLYGSLFLSLVANLIAAFSNSLITFSILRFFIGLSAGGCLSSLYVFASEFVGHNWRGLGSFPFWNIGTCSFAAGVVILKDWRHIHIATAAISALFFLNVIWVPESLRYLAVRGRIKEANRVVRKIVRINRRPVPDTSVFTVIEMQERQSRENQLAYTYRDLFRGDLFKPSMIVMFFWLVLSLSYYTVGFGIKGLSGDFYLNLLLFAVVSLPAKVIVPVVANKLGRQKGCFLFITVSSLCCITVAVLKLVLSQDEIGTPTTVLSLLSIMFLDAGWTVAIVLQTELYPTAVRSLCFAHVTAAARIGGMIAPYLIPGKNIPQYASYSIMGGLLGLCALALLGIEETKGKPLKDLITVSPPTSQDVSKKTKSALLDNGASQKESMVADRV